MIVRSPKDKGSLFPISLELHSSEGMIRSKILRRHRDHECGVGYPTILSIFAHTIDTESAILTGCRNYMTTWAHTERIHRTSVSTMRYELVTRSSELGTHAGITELRSIDHISIMLDAYSHGEWLLDDIESLREDHLIGITSRVSDR
jgi:hypothetical protein